MQDLEFRVQGSGFSHKVFEMKFARSGYGGKGLVLARVSATDGMGCGESSPEP